MTTLGISQSCDNRRPRYRQQQPNSKTILSLENTLKMDKPFADEVWKTKLHPSISHAYGFGSLRTLPFWNRLNIGYNMVGPNRQEKVNTKSQQSKCANTTIRFIVDSYQREIPRPRALKAHSKTISNILFGSKWSEIKVDEVYIFKLHPQISHPYMVRSGHMISFQNPHKLTHRRGGPIFETCNFKKKSKFSHSYELESQTSNISQMTTVYGEVFTFLES